MSSIAVFDGRDEAINLWFPLPFALVTIHQAITGWSLDRAGQGIVDYISSVILLDVPHLTFTIAAVLFIPEAKKWRQEYSKQSTLPIWFYSVLVFGFFFTLTALTHRGAVVGLSPKNMSDLSLLLGVLFLTGSWHHSLAQLRGISAAYSKRHVDLLTHERPREVQRFRLWEKYERLSFKVLYVSTVSMGWAFVIGLGKGDGGWSQGWRWISFALCSLAIFGVVGSIYMRNHREGIRGHQFLFMMRLWFYPVAVLAPIGLKALLAMHAFEYLFTMRRMVTGSEMSQVQRRSFYTGMVLFGIWAALLSTYLGTRGGRLFFPKIPEVPWISWVVFPTIMGLAFLHYYLDRQIFRMREASSRRWIGKLLVS